MRLIDADKLMIKLDYSCNINCLYTEKQRDVMCDSCLLGDAKDYIDSMPTVDAVEVVRCKDCRYYDDENHFCSYIIWAKPDGYCSGGERREDETN